MPLDRDALVKIATCRTQDVDVPGLGSIKLRELSHGELAEVLKLRSSDDVAVRASFARYAVARSVLGPDGGRQFTDAEQDTLLASLDGDAVNAIATAILSFNRATPEALVEEGEASAATS